MEHTKGEWVVGITYVGDWPVYRLRDMQNPGNHVEVDANARLIAAAPDLLEVCERIKQRLDSGGLVKKDTTGLYTCLKNAITKAEQIK